MNHERTVLVDDLVGNSEIAELIGRSRQRVAKLATEDPNFPRPLLTLRSGRIWSRRAVLAWDAKREKGPGRPKRVP